MSGYKYYLVVLDDFTHYMWTSPLRLKSDTFATLKHLFAYVSTQFHTTIQSIQCDNGREFENIVVVKFSYHLVPPFACLAHTPLPKPNVSSAPQITCYIPFFSKPTYYKPIGLKPFTLPLPSSTFTQQKPYNIVHLMRLFATFLPPRAFAHFSLSLLS